MALLETLYSCYVIGSVLISCIINMFCLEMIVRESPNSGNLITFAQFLFVATHGFVTTQRFGTVKRVVPVRCYITLVSLFFVVQVLNNYALAFNISAPLHMIFRSGSLIASLALNVLLLKRSYALSRHLAVWMVTIGVIVCTYASAPEQKGHGSEEDSENFGHHIVTWFIGVAMLTVSLFLSARMGIFQEQLYAQYGKHPMEALYYNHVLPLPFFIFMASDIYSQVVFYNQSPPLTLMGMTMPRMWWLLALNTLSQYFCIRSVFTLTAEYKSLTVTLVVTLRKFLSLVLSIIYFRNPFTFLHWTGASLVFAGTLIYSDVFALVKQSFERPKKE